MSIPLVERVGFDNSLRDYQNGITFKCRMTRGFYPDDEEWNRRYKSAMAADKEYGIPLLNTFARADFEVLCEGMASETWAGWLDQQMQVAPSMKWNIFSVSGFYIGPIAGPVQGDEFRPKSIWVILSDKAMALQFELAFKGQ